MTHMMYKEYMTHMKYKDILFFPFLVRTKTWLLGLMQKLYNLNVGPWQAEGGERKRTVE